MFCFWPLFADLPAGVLLYVLDKKPAIFIKERHFRWPPDLFQSFSIQYNGSQLAGILQYNASHKHHPLAGGKIIQADPSMGLNKIIFAQKIQIIPVVGIYYDFVVRNTRVSNRG